MKIEQVLKLATFYDFLVVLDLLIFP